MSTTAEADPVSVASLPAPYYQDDAVTIYCGDCREILPQLPKHDLLLTDPPYPDWMADEYRYDGELIRQVLDGGPFICFWTAKQEFLTKHDRTHIWDKKTGAGSEYERIYERGCGDNNWKVYRYYLVNSTVAASYTGDVFNEHKSQKPVRLMRQLVIRGTQEGQSILDPFAGSCTTGVAAKLEGRKATLIELEERYCEIGANRLSQGVLF